MKKTFNIVIIAIIAFAVILTLVLLILNLSGKADSGEDTPPPSFSMMPSESPPKPSESAAPASPSISPSPEADGLFIREETPDGVIYTITVNKDLTYRLMTDEAAFECSGDFEGHTFSSLEDENEYLKVCFIEGARSAEIAPSFLDSFISFTEFEQSGSDTIDGTDITGEKIAANDGNTQVEAWLVDTEAGVLAVVISYTLSQKDEQTEKLGSLLATLEIKPENAEGWADAAAGKDTDQPL